MHFRVIIFITFLTLNSLAGPGKFHLFLKNFKTNQLPIGRDIYVYLPPNYDINTTSRYPVLYMHDGQNLYDPARAFMGQTWNAEVTLNQLIALQRITPLIVVAIDNSRDRLNEYTPNADPIYGGGNADVYLEFIAIDLKKNVDRMLRTLPQRETTFMMGSSLGGLVSLYAGIKFPMVFGAVASLSPSIWWSKKSIVSLYKKASLLPDKIYLDCGTQDGERPQDILLFKNSITAKYSDPQNIKTLVQKGAGHSERYWAQRFPEALKFLF